MFPYATTLGERNSVAGSTRLFIVASPRAENMATANKKGAPAKNTGAPDISAEASYAPALTIVVVELRLRAQASSVERASIGRSFPYETVVIREEATPRLTR